MTRYNTPLPQTGGRPAAPGQSPLRTAPAGQQPMPPLRPAQAAYPSQGGYPGQGGSPSQGNYPSQGYGADVQAAAHRDPYAALRPDGYGYATPPQGAAPQPSDPYGLAGYTAPQPPAGQGYAPQPPLGAPAYGQGYDPYQGRGQTQPPQGYAAQPAPSFPAQPSAFGARGYAPQQPSHAPAPDNWGGGSGLAADPRDFAGYAQGHWDGAGADPYFDDREPSLAPDGYQHGQQGHPQQQGSFDQSYAEDDVEYDDAPRRGGGWKKIVGLVTVMGLVGGVLTIAYTSIMGSSSDPTPVVKSAQGPSKVKPSEPGGKQFDYTDSKVMGRLGEAEGSSASAEQDAGSGVKKVPVVAVGRDGSIQAPDSVEPEQTRATVAAPGLTIIDGLGGTGMGPRRMDNSGSSAPAPKVQMVTEPDTPPPAKKVRNADMASVGDDSGSAVPAKAIVKNGAPPKKEKVAVATATELPATSGPQPTGAGYVAVLASVPASGSSRIDALKRFADMQQKYTTVLQNKTPDVQEADLGAKGTYHRLLVGPPGSREAASSVCSQLKAQGYTGCWVTAY